MPSRILNTCLASLSCAATFLGIGSLLLLPCCEQADGTLFNVTATLSESTCGTGAADAQDSWDFQIRLSKEDSTLTWVMVTQQTEAEGVIGDDTFSVSHAETVEVTPATQLALGCSVRRHDNYSGSVTLSKASVIEKLKGQLTFKYTEATGYDCDALIGTSDGFQDLPCEVTYDFTAVPD